MRDFRLLGRAIPKAIAQVNRVKKLCDTHLGIHNQAHLLEFLDDDTSRPVLVDDMLQQPVDQVYKFTTSCVSSLHLSTFPIFTCEWRILQDYKR